MRICIYGAGAMGTSLGVLFGQWGISCDLVSRNRAQIEAFRERGARLISEKADLHTSVSAMLPEEMSGEYDLIFLATKQQKNGEIAAFLRPFLRENGALVTVQNGLPEKSLAEVLGDDRIYGCTLSWGAEAVRPGEVRMTSDSGFHLALGAYGKGERLSEISGLLERIGSVSTGNLKEIRYAKLAMNASFSTLSAISGLPFGEISRRYKKYALTIMREVFAVARAAGCRRLPQNGHDLFRVFHGFRAGVLLPFAMKKYRNTRSGMLKDLQRGRRCDIDFVAGAVVKEGRALGVQTPILTRAVALVHDVENGLAEIAPDSVRLLDD